MRGPSRDVAHTGSNARRPPRMGARLRPAPAAGRPELVEVPAEPEAVMSSSIVRALILATLCAVAWPCAGQGPASAHPDWGTAATSELALSSFAFEPYDQPANTSYSSIPPTGVWRHCLGNFTPAAPCVFVASVQLPTGALVYGIELDALDADPAAEVSADLALCPKLAPLCMPLATAATGIAFNGGPILVPTLLGVPFAVDNLMTSLVVEARISGGTPNTQLSSFRITYGLQVSPAPVTATFSDVPVGHWAFQHVEALSASAITAGCGGGNFCPDQSVTRAQMAVFLAKALGLHWPN